VPLDPVCPVMGAIVRRYGLLLWLDVVDGCGYCLSLRRDPLLEELLLARLVAKRLHGLLCLLLACLELDQLTIENLRVRLPSS
jgi:hypothetical protein